jgi:hypothetical protein
LLEYPTHPLGNARGFGSQFTVATNGNFPVPDARESVVPVASRTSHSPALTGPAGQPPTARRRLVALPAFRNPAAGFGVNAMTVLAGFDETIRRSAAAIPCRAGFPVTALFPQFSQRCTVARAAGLPVFISGSVALALSFQPYSQSSCWANAFELTNRVGRRAAIDPNRLHDITRIKVVRLPKLEV